MKFIKKMNMLGKEIDKSKFSDKPAKIADIEFAFDNGEIIRLLKKRG
jgi:hypothetical protein